MRWLKAWRDNFCRWLITSGLSVFTCSFALPSLRVWVHLCISISKYRPPRSSAWFQSYHYQSSLNPVFILICLSRTAEGAGYQHPICRLCFQALWLCSTNIYLDGIGKELWILDPHLHCSSRQGRGGWLGRARVVLAIFWELLQHSGLTYHICNLKCFM